MNLTTASLTLSSPSSISAKKVLATLINASYGQFWNQSITVLLTKAGNFLALYLKDSPTGEKQSDIWRFFLVLSMNHYQQFSLVSGIPSALTLDRTLLMIPSFSSEVYRSAISPEAKRSLI